MILLCGSISDRSRTRDEFLSYIAARKFRNFFLFFFHFSENEDANRRHSSLLYVAGRQKYILVLFKHICAERDESY